jgi:hypothetical protein
MALFSLTDIKFLPSDNRGSNLTDFNLNNKRYPIDLGSTDKGHYIMFYIFTQNRTQVGQTSQTNISENVFDSRQEVTENVFDPRQDVQESVFDPTFGGTFDDTIGKRVTQFGRDIFNTIQSSTPGSDQNLLAKGNFFRTITKTNDTIALYMPDTLAFDYQQSYSNLSVTQDLGKLGLAAQAGASTYDAYRKTGSISSAAKNAAPFAAELAREAGLPGSKVLFSALSAVTGGALAINPQLELIYEGTDFRSFRFSFMFYPRSKKEAIEILDIIDSFTFHQAPEILSSSFGRYLVPPSEFEIEFRYNGGINPNIPKVAPCVLTSISVDYAPSGFASYETLLSANKPERGGTGMPVAIRMDLSFKETRIITKQFLKGEREGKYNSPFGSTGGGSTDSVSQGNSVSTTQVDSAGFTVASDIDDLSIGLENTATSDTEFDLANGSWGTEDTTGIDDTGSGGTIGGA